MTSVSSIHILFRFQHIMMTGHQLTFSLLILSVILGISEARCKCEHDTQLIHYEELGCDPVYAKEDDCCPSYYNCDAKLPAPTPINKGIEGLPPIPVTPPPPAVCHFRGKVFGPGQKIDQDLTIGSCRAGCSCQAGHIICAIVDCAEFFGHNKLGPDCRRQYKLNSCCSSGNICPPFDKVATCTVNNKTYYEGERFYPEEEPCKQCVCQKGFEGKYEQPFCQTVNCAFEPKIGELRKFCAPVYFGKTRCCPITWNCSPVFPPSDKVPDDKEKATEKTTAVDKTKNCIFGGKTLTVGEKMDLEPQVNCECVVPPLMTCIRTEN